MTGLVVLLFVIVAALVVAWFVFPQSRQFIAGAGAAVALGLAGILTNFAQFLNGAV